MKPHKPCSVPGCNYPVFARGFCPSHYRSLYLAPRKKFVIRKPIAKRTASRFSDEFLYKSKRELFIERERSKHPKRVLFCIFCGMRIPGEPSLHHYAGRDGDNLLDESKWLLSHNSCHVNEYHSMSWQSIPWWNEYLERIRYKYPDLYGKELLKMSK